MRPAVGRLQTQQHCLRIWLAVPNDLGILRKYHQACSNLTLSINNFESVSAKDCRDIGRRSASQTRLEHLVAKKSQIHCCQDNQKSLGLHSLPPPGYRFTTKMPTTAGRLE